MQNGGKPENPDPIKSTIWIEIHMVDDKELYTIIWTDHDESGSAWRGSPASFPIPQSIIDQCIETFHDHEAHLLNHENFMHFHCRMSARMRRSVGLKANPRVLPGTPAHTNDKRSNSADPGDTLPGDTT